MATIDGNDLLFLSEGREISRGDLWMSRGLAATVLILGLYLAFAPVIEGNVSLSGGAAGGVFLRAVLISIPTMAVVYWLAVWFTSSPAGE